MGKTVYTIRNYDPGDFDNYVRLHAETAAQDGGGHFFSKQRLAEDLGHPRLYPQKNVFVAEQDGSLIGCVSVFLEPEIGRALLDGLVHPLQRKKGIATGLFDRGIEHVRRAGVKVAQICVPQTSRAAKHLMNRLGLDYIRRFIGMELDLTAGQLPDITRADDAIRHLRAGEVQMLADIQNRSFAESWGFNPNTAAEIDYRIHLSTCSPDDVILACRGDKAIGYCWTRKLAGENADVPEPGRGEIHMLGVDPDFQKQGLGRKLVLAGLSHLKAKSITRVELTSDAENLAAVRLYESIGFKESRILEWYEKKLNS